MIIDDFLKRLNACSIAKEWAKGKEWEEIYNTYPNGSWLSWLFYRTNIVLNFSQEDFKLFVLVSGNQCLLIKNLIEHKNSLDAVYAAIRYGEGYISLEQLIEASKKASDIAKYSNGASASFAADAAYSAISNPQNTANYINKATGKMSESLGSGNDDCYEKKMADIFREYIPITKFKLNDNL